VSSQIHDPAGSLLAKEPPVSVNYEAGWTVGEEMSFVPAGNQTIIPRVTIP
jgi:hypothetical protein